MRLKVKNREVFYISGYDPRGSRHYYGLYKKHLIQQNKFNGLNATISNRKVKGTSSSWEIRADDEGTDVQTKYNFLSWTDIILENWSKNSLDILKNFFFGIFTHLLSGQIVQYTKLAPYMLLIGFYSVMYVFSMFALTGYIGYAFSIYLGEYSSFYLSLPLSILLMYFIFQLFVKFGKKLAIFWLFNIYAITAKYSRGKLPKLEKKIDSFAGEIYNVILNSNKNNIDEILLVGHSIGSILSIPVAVKVLQKCHENGIDPSKFKLLTLAGNIPLVSMYKKAFFYREYLQYLHDAKTFVWLDYTSTIDGTCFPLFDPLQSKGLIRKQGKYPIILSTRFYKLFSKENYKKFRYKWFEVHFLYIMSSNSADGYDYFKITAGRKPLEKTL